MKTWLLVLLVAFSVIAGFKVVSYQQKLDHSKVEHERLSDVLARSRSTQTSELKIIKPIKKVKEERETADVSAAHKDLLHFLVCLMAEQHDAFQTRLPSGCVGIMQKFHSFATLVLGTRLVLRVISVCTAAWNFALNPRSNASLFRGSDSALTQNHCFESMGGWQGPKPVYV